MIQTMDDQSPDDVDFRLFYWSTFESFEVTLIKNVEEVDLHLFPVHVF